MAISDYYFSRQRVPGYGNMFILKQLQAADDEGGGESLLGTLAEEEYETWGPFRHSWYPVPQHMSRPSLIRHLLEDRKEDLGIGDDVALEVGLAGGSDQLVFKKGSAFEGGAGPFPGVPLALAVRVDYARMSQAKVVFGKGTRLKYIPYGYIAALYQSVKGEDVKLVPSGLLGKNNVIDRILVARRFTVSFESEADFDAEFEAKLDALNAMQGAQARVSYSLASKRTVVAEIDSPERYLVALSERNWDDYNPD